MKKTIIITGLLLVSFLIQLKSQTNSEIWVNKDIRLTYLKDSVYLHTTWDETFPYSKGYGGSNGIIIVKNGEGVMVDTPTDDIKTQTLSEYLMDSLNIKITTCIAGHYHPDCVGGLNYLKDQGVESIANQMTIEKCKEIGVAVPETSFVESMDIDFNGLKIECRYFGGGHSFDNITVCIPKKNILFGGCLIKSIDATRIGLVPNESVLNEWDITVNRILENYQGKLLVIPGHGKVGSEDLLHHTVKLAVKKKSQ